MNLFRDRELKKHILNFIQNFQLLLSSTISLVDSDPLVNRLSEIDCFLKQLRTLCSLKKDCGFRAI